MKVLFVNHGAFDCNSGGHIARFARGLHARGHAVAVAAEGREAGAADWGPAPFSTLPRRLLAQQPATALAFDGRAPDLDDTVLIGWTPREGVRAALEAVRRRLHVRTVYHLEDDERALTAAHLGRTWNDLAATPPRELDPLIAPSLAHPHRMADALAGADGVTAIARPLLTLAGGAPAMLLRPGCDPAELGPVLTAQARAEILRAVGVDPAHKVILYPGNLHAANRREMFSLYVATAVLRRRGIAVTLVRTGEDFGPGHDLAFEHLKGRVSRELGRQPRRELMRLLRCADLCVQPGAPNAFNLCRLPSKLPELFATGRPVLLPRANLGLEVEDGVEAAVLDRGDGVEIADRAEPLLRDEARARAMGAAGLRFARRVLDWEASTDHLERFLQHLVLRPRRRRWAA